MTTNHPQTNKTVEVAQRTGIRPIDSSDYERVSELISRCLTQVNIRDYGQEHIAKMLPTFASSNLADWFKGAEPFVVVSAGELVATGTLRDHEIQTVFVDPSKHGMGYGKLLMKYLEDIAKSRGIAEITLRSSLTSKAFYESLHYQAQGNTYGAVGGQMILMTKKL
jgi:GNAT superfamily N-acetyltransferase